VDTDLADWSFSMEEVSAGVYRVRGVDSSGRNVETSATDPDSALEACKQAAAAMADDSSAD
jgi:hypothetical protein